MTARTQEDRERLNRYQREYRKRNHEKVRQIEKNYRHRAGVLKLATVLALYEERFGQDPHTLELETIMAMAQIA